MGELGLNKILGAVLATVLVALGLNNFSSMIFPSGSHGGGHHGEEEHHSLNEKIAATYAYYVEVQDSAGGPVVEEVFDLGAALALADVSSGERSFRQKCVTCHTIEEGGANGTGPNLWAVVGAPKNHLGDNFAYSSAMLAMDDDWTYENLNAWLENPGSYARGTTMAFAGLRREDERVNVIAYLASYTPDAPAFPDPLPEPGSEEIPAVDEGQDVVEAIVEEAGETANEGVETVSDTVDEAVETVTDSANEILEEAPDTADDLLETVEEASEEALDVIDGGSDEN